MALKITIKDIAEKAGVSVGTVDRVLHKRSNVSQVAKEKVVKVMDDLNYHPNAYASALAYNKDHSFVVLIPNHESEAYWEEIEQGVQKAADVLRDFKTVVKIQYYERFNSESFLQQAKECLDGKPDGVVIVPTDLDITKTFTDQLHSKGIPFVLLDSYLPDVEPLSFWGQNSFYSGLFAGRMLMLLAAGDKELMLFKRVKNGHVTSKQQENREVGFKHYMNEHFPQVKISELQVTYDATREETDSKLSEFFAQHPDVHHCITFNSKAHIVGDYLLRNDITGIQIMGYDMVDKNAECMRQGSISFIIAQHGYQQGYGCVDTLFRAIVLKQGVRPINNMPIELLTKENVDFYQRTQH